jgi:hypothetical protein
MCLDLNVTYRKASICKAAKAIKEAGRIIAYKGVKKYDTGISNVKGDRKTIQGGKNDSIVLVTPFQNVEILPGWFKSNRTPLNRTPAPAAFEGMVFQNLSEKEIEGARVDSGIHVFLSEMGAKKEAGESWLVLPVVCYAKDLVAVGTFYGNLCAVFTKIFVPKKSTIKALE